MASDLGAGVSHPFLAFQQAVSVPTERAREQEGQTYLPNEVLL